ncbi:MAG: c-type cytochrome [Bacteroidota bacterium]|nr:c-type cytochrome [Bacteroidota bacterium]
MRLLKINSKKMCSSTKIDFYKHLQSHRVLVFLLSFLILIFLGTVTVHAQDDAQADVAADQADSAQEPAATEGGGGINGDVGLGKSLFTNECTVCHALDRKLIGPALAGVTERRPIPWLISFIRNSSKVIQSGDDYAVNLFNQYNKMQMPAFAYSDEEILSILAYIEQESAAPPAAADGGPAGTAEPGAQAAGGTGSGVPSEYLLAILGGLLIVLVLILVILILIVNMISKFLTQKRDLDEEDKELVDQKIDVKKVVKSKPFLGILIFIFVAVALKAVVDGLFGIGIQQGYAPKQPIAFSHQLHAGQYEIDCQYCHTTVMKSKNASIPSVNICMNCHNSILPESTEIQKIYAAIDYNPETREYGTNQKPIEWVRIHNLPDLAYFNHAQHTAVGGVACQTCHGPIQEMQVVRQHAQLTMGWCINCHRETTVNTKDNHYYDNLVELHNAVSSEPLKVKDIGGLECSKCHF